MNDKKEEKSIEVRVEAISQLLEEALELYKKDRKIALSNYESMRDQLDLILEDEQYMSEDGAIERAVNASLKLVFESGKRLDKVMESSVKLAITQLISENKLQIADKFFGGDGGNQKLGGPIDFKKLIEGKD